jgi:hypothetical protein
MIDVATAVNIVVGVVTASATIVLALYAKQQLDEAARDRESRRQAAIDTLFAEASRILRLSARWSQLDLVELAHKNQLAIDDLLPPDWGLIMTLLGQVGAETALLGGVAYGKLNDAVLHARDLQQAVDRRNGFLAEEIARGRDSSIVESLWSKHATDVVGAIRVNLTDAAAGLFDAIDVATPMSRKLAIPGRLTSNVAEEVREAVRETLQPPGRGSE